MMEPSAPAQDFSIIISGMDEFSSVPNSCSSDLINPTDGASNVLLATTIEWQEVPDATSYDLYFGTDGGGSSTPMNIENGTNILTTSYNPDLTANTTYYIQVIPRNNQGPNTSCTSIWTFTTGNHTPETTYPIIENFDAFTGGIGSGNNWYDATDDDINWLVNIGSTPSGNTGPSADHTFGSGRYLYIEASGVPNSPNKTADLLSLPFNLDGLNNPTFQFWYHMWDGANNTGGNLYVDVYNQGSWQNVFSVAGNQGNEWHVATIDLDNYKTGSVQTVRFRGITGEFWSSDIAIDDFEVRSEAFHSYPVNNTDNYLFENTNLSIQFSTGNSGEADSDSG